MWNGPSKTLRFLGSLSRIWRPNFEETFWFCKEQLSSETTLSGWRKFYWNVCELRSKMVCLSSLECLSHLSLKQTLIACLLAHLEGCHAYVVEKLPRLDLCNNRVVGVLQSYQCGGSSPRGEPAPPGGKPLSGPLLRSDTEFDLVPDVFAKVQFLQEHKFSSVISEGDLYPYKTWWACLGLPLISCPFPTSVHLFSANSSTIHPKGTSPSPPNTVIVPAEANNRVFNSEDLFSGIV